MDVPVNVLELVERFDRNLDAYRSGQYNETQVRHEFIDPFFEALGWDVNNRQGYAEAYKDVVHEDAIKIGGFTKAPDYCFRIGGTRKFFLEAKKPSVNIKEDISPAFQLRRYAWSAKLPLSILTDFEEFAVYDCRIKPDKADKSSTARTFYLRYPDYPQRWTEIASIFSREAVLKGSFDKYAESTKAKKGTAEVDTAFLKEIEAWRETLARNLAWRNPGLTQRELNFAVQQTIDRIIFLRICEDRGIEVYGQLMALQNGAQVYERLCHLLRRADDRYNSGLFHFRPEKGRPEHPDELSLNLAIDDHVLKDILKQLYYPDSPYEFSVLPADILGQVYEQFLGKVIRLTPGHRAIIEDKPEVKKAGGVFYTPTYIVDYIVKHTVGKLLEGKTPKQVAKLRILDPACGSGSFLIGAYQYLLDWHRDWYTHEGPGKWATGRAPAVYQAHGGDWHLTTAERKRILLNNIYGVDIDPQAVEVTKLSLLLKVLEGENEETLGKQLALFQERALPDLGHNIMCGNSLIGPDFYDRKQISFVDDEERYRINAFNWEAEFPEIMRAGGFDVVIGNPPYVRIQTMQEWMPRSADYFKRVYQSARTGNYDIYVAFVERGLSLLNPNGRLGFIMPQKFWQVQYGNPLRGLISEGKNVERVVNFTHNQVFATAFVNTCIMILSKSPKDWLEYTEVAKVEKGIPVHQALAESPVTVLQNRVLTGAPWILKPGQMTNLLEKLSDTGLPLGNCTKRIFQGLKTSADKIFVLEMIQENPSSLIGYSTQLGKEVEVERDLFHTLIKGTEMRRYTSLPARRIILFPYINVGASACLVQEDRLQREFPKTFAYLKANEKYLRGRENGKMNHEGWYGYGRVQALDVMSLPKLITPDLAPRSSFLVDNTGEFFFLGGAAGGYGILPKPEIHPLYLLGLLNSRVLSFFITLSGQQMESGYYSFEARFIRSAPIRTLNFSDPRDKARHNQMVQLVERMLALHKQLAAAKTGHDKTLLQRQIEATDRQIDRLVYELYGLTEEEIKIVEGQRS